MIDLGGFVVNINVADGTYSSGVVVSGPFTGSGVVQLIGDVASPSSCIISSTSTCIVVELGAVLYVKGFEVTSSGTAVTMVAAIQGGKIFINGNMNIGSAGSGGYQLSAIDTGSYLSIGSNYTISGGGAYHLHTDTNGELVYTSGQTVTLTGTPVYSGAFAQALHASNIAANSITYSGSATGVRYSSALNGVIDTFSVASATYFPGNSPGSTATGGQYA